MAGRITRTGVTDHRVKRLDVPVFWAVASDPGFARAMKLRASYIAYPIYDQRDEAFLIGYLIGRQDLVRPRINLHLPRLGVGCALSIYDAPERPVG
jgi:hypothetical protein